MTLDLEINEVEVEVEVKVLTSLALVTGITRASHNAATRTDQSSANGLTLGFNRPASLVRTNNHRSLY
jgi:hypothetical protein